MLGLCGMMEYKPKNISPVLSTSRKPRKRKAPTDQSSEDKAMLRFIYHNRLEEQPSSSTALSPPVRDELSIYLETDPVIDNGPCEFETLKW